MDSSNPIDLDSGVAANTELDDNQEYFGTKPSSQLTVPNFSAENYNEELRDKNNLIGQPTVIWFFPAAGTYGWTVEGCGYRDNYEEFQNLGVQIVGVGFQEPDVNAAWAEAEGFQYEIWTDTNRELGIYYGAASSPSSNFPNRITRLLDENGSLLLEYNDVNFGTNPRLVLEDCQLLFGE